MADVRNSWLALAETRLDWLAHRESLIARNVANSETPDYKAQDVQSFESYLDGVEASANRETVDVFDMSGDWGGTPNGNTVSLSEQSMMSADTVANHRLATQLYAKGYQLMSLAVTGQKT